MKSSSSIEFSLFLRTTWKYFQHIVVIRVIKRLKFDRSIGERKQWSKSNSFDLRSNNFFKLSSNSWQTSIDCLSFLSLSFLFSSLSFFPSPSPLRLITEGRAITTSHRFARQRCGIVAFNIKNPTFFLSFCPSFYPFLTPFCLLFLSFFLPSVPSRKSSLARPRARRRGKSQMRRKKKKRSAIAVGRWWRAIRGRKEDLRAPLAAARRDRNGAITKQRRFKGLFAGFVYRVTSSASSVCTFFHPPERVRDK